ncbi:hypothetical protein DDJ31_39295 [Streptomyces griseoviridis]|uniref:Uncharacterized protein n=1 Tax=Streptomyces griseoviridis TaxID=45398 RepID=A0ABX5U7A9_STRGD|nr:hypothetical protein DDJ31_39295 [Streptomyces griseoviridis]
MTDVQGSVLEGALVGSGDVGLVEGVDFDSGSLAVAVEACEEVAGYVLAAEGVVGGFDALEVFFGGVAFALEPGFVRCAGLVSVGGGQ